MQKFAAAHGPTWPGSTMQERDAVVARRSIVLFLFFYFIIGVAEIVPGNWTSGVSACEGTHVHKNEF